MTSLFNFLCQCGNLIEDCWHDRDSEGKPLPKVCECGSLMSVMIAPPIVKYSNTFWRGQSPRKIGCRWVDENGKQHERDLTHSVGNITIGEGDE
jgi:hypothetical protein